MELEKERLKLLLLNSILQTLVVASRYDCDQEQEP